MYLSTQVLPFLYSERCLQIFAYLIGEKSYTVAVVTFHRLLVRLNKWQSNVHLVHLLAIGGIFYL